MRPIRSVLLVALLLAQAAPPAAAQESALGLPTPAGFYRSYDVEAEGKRLYGQFLDSLDPQSRILISKLFEEAASGAMPDIPKEQAREFVRSLDWKSKKRELLDQLLFRSQVLDLVPPASRERWMPIVHDALIFFLGNLAEERLLDLAWNVARLPPDASRGEKIVTLADRIPSLQKLAQILARNPAIAPDIRAGLQTLENSIRTTSRDEVVRLISMALGEQRVRELHLDFDGKVLAEASVGAVIKATAAPPGESQPVRVVVKVLKPYALKGLPEEMDILDRMTEYFERHSGFYRIDQTPVTGMFRDLRSAWEQELKVEQEQEHLRAAAAYYAGHAGVKIPRLIDATPHVTIMEFIDGERITDAFPQDGERRAVLARRLYDVMSFEPIYGSHDIALFHGDPHAGNVFHMRRDSQDPYRIALLDWGLMGEFGKQQRRRIAQLFLGLEYRDKKRMATGVSGMIAGGLPEDPLKRRRLDEIFEQVFEIRNVKSAYQQLGELLRLLAFEGYKVERQFALFIKAQLTIAGILAELDPEFDQLAYGRSRVRRMVLRELPRRLLLLPAWNYHGYRSMMSNQDVLRSLF